MSLHGKDETVIFGDYGVSKALVILPEIALGEGIGGFNKISKGRLFDGVKILVVICNSVSYGA